MAGPSPQGTHFYLIAIQYPRPDGNFGIVHANGTWTPKRRQSRCDVFNEIRSDLERQYPHCQDGAVVAFDIQPNKL